MWFLFACRPSPPPEPPEVPCLVSAADVGEPTGRIEACDVLPGFPEVLLVRVGGRGHTVRVQAGKVSTERGGPALLGFLTGLAPDRRSALDLPGIFGLLRAFDAFPPDFDATCIGFDLPDVGRTSFEPAPFRLILYQGIPPEPRFIRATLTLDPPQWIREERQTDGTWKQTGTTRLSPPAPVAPPEGG